MNTIPQPKPYDQAREEAFADHISNSGGRSVYMQADFDAGFSAGYNAAMNNVAARKREDALRERAAIAAMDAILKSGVTIRMNGEAVDFSPVNTAKASVVFATALINQLKNQES